MRKLIPTWITIISSLIALLGLFVGCSLYISPGTFIPTIDFSSPDIKFLTHMWAARQVAIALIIAYSLFRQSAPMLKISLAAYCLMNLQDVVIGILQNDSGLAIGAAVFSTLSAILIFVLIKRKEAKY